MKKTEIEKEISEFFKEWKIELIKRQTRSAEIDISIIEEHIESDKCPKVLKNKSDDLVQDWLLSNKIYLIGDIDLNAICMVLIEEGLSVEKSKDVTLRIAQTIIYKFPRGSTKTRDRLDKALSDARQTLSSMKEITVLDKWIATEVVKNVDPDPRSYLTDLQLALEGALEKYFPQGKQSKSHDEIIRKIAVIWRTNVGEPKLHDESAFVRVMSYCLNLSYEVTRTTIRRVDGYKSI